MQRASSGRIGWVGQGCGWMNQTGEWVGQGCGGRMAGSSLQVGESGEWVDQGSGGRNRDAHVIEWRVQSRRSCDWVAE